MRTLIFTLTLVIYGFSAMEISHWVRVPQVVVHLLEYHSPFGHPADSPAQQGHDKSEGHNPFGHDSNEVCCPASVLSLPVAPCTLISVHPAEMSLLGSSDLAFALADYTGSKWNPPKLV